MLFKGQMYLLLDYEIMSKLFLLGYLKLPIFSKFSSESFVCLFFNQKNIPCTPVVREMKENRVSTRAGQTWQAEDKWEPGLITKAREGKRSSVKH